MDWAASVRRRRGVKVSASGMAAALAVGVYGCSAAPPVLKATEADSPLALAGAIALPDTAGRIDHLAVDVAGRRLFVAEVANGSVDVVDLAARRVVGRVKGLTEPQGVAWLPARGEFVVGCGDGTVRFYRAADRAEVASVALGEDADNVRVDARNGRVVVGYGSGGLAVIDPVSHQVIRRVTFKGHPEGFRLSGAYAYVNDPDDGAVLAVDLDAGRVVGRWPTGGLRFNFPMAVEPSGERIAVAYRLPARLVRIDTRTGAAVSRQPVCGDADDLFLVGARVLVVCGAGSVDVVADGRVAARVATGPGARTGLFVPEWGQLFVAVPSRGAPAAIWVLALKGAEGPLQPHA